MNRVVRFREIFVDRELGQVRLRRLAGPIDRIEELPPRPDIAELAKVFGISDVSTIGFPFQKHGSSDGKKFELRIEPSASHNVAGEYTVGHQWIFRQTSPELTA